jgi:hypothetical protein
LQAAALGSKHDQLLLEKNAARLLLLERGAQPVTVVASHLTHARLNNDDRSGASPPRTFFQTIGVPI